MKREFRENASKKGGLDSNVSKDMKKEEWLKNEAKEKQIADEKLKQKWRDQDKREAGVPSGEGVLESLRKEQTEEKKEILDLRKFIAGELERVKEE